MYIKLFTCYFYALKWIKKLQKIVIETNTVDICRMVRKTVNRCQKNRSFVWNLIALEARQMGNLSLVTTTVYKALLPIRDILSPSNPSDYTDDLRIHSLIW